MLRPAALAALLVLAACDSTADEFVPLPVVSATLVSGEPLAPVRLTRLQPLDASVPPGSDAIAGATVVVELLAADGSVERTLPYADGTGGPAGLYQLAAATPADTATAIPGRTYRLRVTAPAATGTGTDEIVAETTVPARLRFVEPPPDSVVYGVGLGPEVRITTSSTAARRSVYLLAAQALAPAQFDAVVVDGASRFRQVADPDRFDPVPVVQTFLGCDRGADGLLLCDDDPSEAGTGRSPLLNEDSYTLLGDGTARVAVPFIAFGFYGPQRVTFFSLDDALVDFVETQAIQFAPTTISPGEVPNATTNVRGGLGVFGSLAQATAFFRVDPPAP